MVFVKRGIGIILLTFMIIGCRARQVSTLQPPLPTSLDASLTTGDILSYAVINSQGEAIAQFQTVVTGIEQWEDFTTWVLKTTIQSSAGPQQQSTFMAWVDQASGVQVKSGYWVVYATPQANTFNGQKLEIKEFSSNRIFDLGTNTVKETQSVVDSEGNNHEMQVSGPADYSLFRLIRKVVIDEYYPWQTVEFPHQVIDEKMIRVPAGNFKSWVIKHVISAENQYYLEYYDQVSGLMVKSENYAQRGEKWEKIEETQLTAFTAGDG